MQTAAARRFAHDEKTAAAGFLVGCGAFLVYSSTNSILASSPLMLESQCEKLVEPSESSTATSHSQQQEEEEEMERVIHRLKQLQITTVAIDFDRTMIGIHTGGLWSEHIQELIPHVRPQFRRLLPALLDAGISVAVVTFSPQQALVRAIVEDIVGNDAAKNIPFRAGSRFWFLHHGGYGLGKNSQLASLDVDKSNLLLIDDSLMTNILFAKLAGIRALYLDPEEPEILLEDLANLI